MMMILSVVSNEGDVMAPHVFTKDLRVNNDEFINILETLNKTVEGLGIRKSPLHLTGGWHPC
jgi:hypothetical protein